MSKPKAAQQVDTSIGAKIRLRRTSMGISQSALAAMLGITVHQFNMYESGKSRLGAARLHAIAMNLSLNVDELFSVEESVTFPTATEETPAPNLVVEFLSQPDVLRFNKEFARVVDPAIRLDITNLVLALGDHYSGNDSLNSNGGALE